MILHVRCDTQLIYNLIQSMMCSDLIFYNSLYVKYFLLNTIGQALYAFFIVVYQTLFRQGRVANMLDEAFQTNNEKYVLKS